jgi:rhodanese-related sulfurtransferase
MNKNLGIVDRIVRVVIVVGLAAAAWYWSSWVLGIVAGILAIEAAVGWCWLYHLLGISSADIDPAGRPEEATFDEVAKRAVSQVTAGTAVLLDVRTQDEWDAGHASGALHWPLDKLERGEVPDIPKDRTIYTHCMAGGRATQATNLLKGKGFTDVSCMGGLSDWEKAGGSLEQ